LQLQVEVRPRVEPVLVQAGADAVLALDRLVLVVTTCCPAVSCASRSKEAAAVRLNREPG
jgi:hypothetical protein